MATVKALLDRLAAGGMTAAQVAADFRGRSWPARPQASDAQAFGVADGDPPGDDSWALVEADSRLSPAQYAVLMRAHERGAAKR